MRKYVVTLVLKPETKQEELLKEVKDILGAEGKVESEGEVTVKKLAYPVDGSTEAGLLQITIDVQPAVLTKLTNELRVNEKLKRFLVTSVEAPKKE